MDEPFFLNQLQRLRNQWPHSYGKERTHRIWITFKKSTNPFFAEIIDYALDTARSSPLVEDLLNFETEVKKRNFRRDTQGDGNLVTILTEAAKTNKRADPEFVQACMKLIKDRFFEYKLTSEQFYEGCDYLMQCANQLNP